MLQIDGSIPTELFFHATFQLNVGLLILLVRMSINSIQEFLMYRFIFLLPIMKIVGQAKDTVKANTKVLLNIDLGYCESIENITANVTHNPHATLMEVKLRAFSLI